MSDKTEEERLKDKENVIIQKMIMGEIMPDLVQSYRIIKNCIDSGISKGIFTAGDTALLVRAFDTLRGHINDQANITTAETTEEVDVEDDVETTVENVMVDEAPEVSIDVEEKETSKKPPRRRR